VSDPALAARRAALAPAAACASAIGLALMLAGCRGEQSMSQPVADQAAAIQWLWHLMLWVTVPIFVLVVGALVLALVHRRDLPRRQGDYDATEQRGLSRGLALWSGAITLILGGLALGSYHTDRRLLTDDAPGVQMQVTGKQWWWQVDYLGADPSTHFTTVNELHLPVNTTTQVKLSSADVIHSLWLPRLAGKMDLVPGRDNVLRLTPRTTGRYRGQCAEFCGLQHANMAIDVVVESPAAFAAWRAAQLQPAPAPSTPSAQRGQQVFMDSACMMCHAIAGTGAAARAAPDLTHVASRRWIGAGALPMGRAEMLQWLSDPQHPKPGNNMPRVPLTPAQLTDLTDYLMTLR
jgi:cytochrome c oxidase subunit 2